MHPSKSRLDLTQFRQSHTDLDPEFFAAVRAGRLPNLTKEDQATLLKYFRQKYGEQFDFDLQLCNSHDPETFKALLKQELSDINKPKFLILLVRPIDYKITDISKISPEDFFHIHYKGEQPHKRVGHVLCIYACLLYTSDAADES